MNRLDRIEIVEELEKYVNFHEDKANYYNDMLIQEKIKLKTIGFLTTDNFVRDSICFTTISSDVSTIQEGY